MTFEEYHWDELSSNEVFELLKQLAGEEREPVSGFLDIHQWLPLADRPGVSIAGGCPDAQFRRVGLGAHAPEVSFFNIPVREMPNNARQAHGARVYLDKVSGGRNAVGDLVRGSHIAFAAIPGAFVATGGLPLQQTEAWSPPALKPNRVTAAANRMDAVVSSVFQISREEARTAIKYSFIYRNLEPVRKRTEGVETGDILMFRTKGKAEIDTVGINERSGRLWLDVILQPA